MQDVLHQLLDEMRKAKPALSVCKDSVCLILPAYSTLPASARGKALRKVETKQRLQKQRCLLLPGIPTPPQDFRIPRGQPWGLLS